MKTIFGIILLIILFGCSTGEVVKNYNAGNPIITLQATSCYGKCPEFEITIKGSGDVTYIGKKNVDKIGKYEIKISEKEIDELLNAFKDAKFWDMNDKYTAKITDLPTIYISCLYNGKIKSIEDYYGAPDELKMLEERIIHYKSLIEEKGVTSPQSKK